MPDHRGLISAEVHECIHITDATTADSGKVITPSSTTNAVSVIRQLTPTDLNYVTGQQTNALTGWVTVKDSTYTSGSPLVVTTAGVSLPNNAALAGTDVTRMPSIWNVAGSKITPEGENYCYTLEVAFSCTTASAANYTDIIVRDAVTSGAIKWVRTIFQPQTGATDTRPVFTFTIPITAALLANGMNIRMIPIVGNVSVYDIVYTIARIHRE